MNIRTKVAGHPVHPMLIVFPLGLLATSFIFDLIGLASGNPVWFDRSYSMIIAGIVGGLAAAVFGFLDWLALPWNTRAKTVGLWHGAGNVVVVVLFFVSAIIRTGAPAGPSGWAVFFSFLGVGLAVITGWLGGELVNRLGVGVHTGAHLNSPSSLSGRQANEDAGPEGIRRVI